MAPWISLNYWWNGESPPEEPKSSPDLDASDSESDDTPTKQSPAPAQARKAAYSKPLPDVPQANQDMERMAVAAREARAVYDEIEGAQQKVRDWRDELSNKEKQKAAKDAESLRGRNRAAQQQPQQRPRKTSESVPRGSAARPAQGTNTAPLPQMEFPVAAQPVRQSRSNYRYYQSAHPNHSTGSFVTDRMLQASANEMGYLAGPAASRPTGPSMHSLPIIRNNHRNESNTELVAQAASSSTHSLPLIEPSTPPRSSQPHVLYQPNPMTPQHMQQHASNNPAFSPLVAFPGTFVFTPQMPTRHLPPIAQPSEPVLMHPPSLIPGNQDPPQQDLPPSNRSDDPPAAAPDVPAAKQSRKTRGRNQAMDPPPLEPDHDPARPRTRSRGHVPAQPPPPAQPRTRGKNGQDSAKLAGPPISGRQQRPVSAASATSLQTQKSTTDSDESSASSVSTLATNLSKVAARKRRLGRADAGEDKKEVSIIQEASEEVDSEASATKRRRRNVREDPPRQATPDPETELQYLLDELEDELTTPAKPKTRHRRAPNDALGAVDESGDMDDTHVRDQGVEGVERQRNVTNAGGGRARRTARK
jgi:hypothetical protein